MGFYKQLKQDKADKRRAKSAARRENGTQSDKAEWRGFVAYSKTAEMRTACETFARDAGTVWDMLQACLDINYKFTLRWDAGSEAYIAMFYCEAGGRPDSGLALSAFADNPWDAMSRATYILAVWGQMSLAAECFTLPDGNKRKRDFWE
jgi:hypothetical protein